MEMPITTVRLMSAFCAGPVAKTVGDATTLVENGFEYVTDIEGMKLFRKRK